MTDVISDADLLADFNNAADENAILTLIHANMDVLLDSERIGKMSDLPDRQERESSVASIIKEIRSFFGPFQTLDELKGKLSEHIDYEHAKHVFVQDIDSAMTADEMMLALAHIGTLNEHRQGLIQAWSSVEGNDALQARLDELRTETYTVVLSDITSRLYETPFMEELVERIMAARDAVPGDRFVDLAKIIDAIDAAADAIDQTSSLAAFNDATTPEAMLDAIDAYAAILLIGESGQRFNALPDREDAQQAIADSLIEIRTLFGEFTSLASIKAALDRQIDIKYAEHLFIGSLDSAASAEGATAAIKTSVELLHNFRQALIAEWSTSVDAEVMDRVEELKADPYTLALAEAAKHLEDANYMGELGFLMLAARNDLADGRFNEILNIVDALVAADEIIDIPHAAEISGTNTGSVEEDGSQSAGGTLSVTDRDWGESIFKAVADLKKQYGVFTFDADTGKWSFTVDNAAAQSLKDGQTVQQTLVVSSYDGTATQTITVTLKGRNDAPEDISLFKAEVTENARTATVIGQLSAIDPDMDGSFDFTLLDNAEDRFDLAVIDGVTSLVVKDGTKLDHEQAKSHRIKVLAKDAAGAFFEKTLTINVKDLAREKATGSSSSDVLKGGGGKDSLKGGAGDDRLWGGYGNDQLTGNSGKDVFVFDSKLGTARTDRKVNFDTITDFKSKDDTIWLDNKIFKKLGRKGSEDNPAKLKKSYFVIGEAAQDRNDHLVYDKKKGILYYDVDGSGAKAAVEIAQFRKNPKIVYKDFLVI